MVALNDPNSYENKFAEFIRLLAETAEEVVMIHHPEVIEDTYEELVESLNRLADAVTRRFRMNLLAFCVRMT